MRQFQFLLVVGAAAAGLASPAVAQWYGGSSPYNAPPPPYGYGSGPSYERPLPRDVIVDRLEDRGFDDVGRPRLDGQVYTVEALSRRSGPVRLVVDAYSGRVLRETPLAVARIGREDDDGIEIDSYDVPRRGAGLPPEMPNAPRYRPEDPDDRPRREALRPTEPDFVAPRSGERSRPTDPRLAPDAPMARSRDPETQAPRREASRPSAPEAGVSPGGVEGVNPDARRTTRPAAKPKADVATRPPDAPGPAARTAPSAPVPSATLKPEENKPAPGSTTAEAGERKVRVIQGVTPLNSGAQSSPAPQNNVDAAAKPALPPQN